jgi:hypothetical protein
MTITWHGPLAIVAGTGRRVTIESLPRIGSDNDALWAVGSSYGVIKLDNDPPHWSVDGR